MYNPYASEPIKHMKDLSRAEIDKLMVKMKRDKEIRKKRILEAQQSTSPHAAKKEQGTASKKEQGTTSEKETASVIDTSAIRKKNMLAAESITKKVAITRGGVGAGQFDISMRARREQQFREKMSAQPLQSASSLSGQSSSSIQLHCFIGTFLFRF